MKIFYINYYGYMNLGQKDFDVEIKDIFHFYLYSSPFYAILLYWSKILNFHALNVYLSLFFIHISIMSFI